MGYTRSALKGVSWMVGLQTVFRLFTFLKIVVLARVLIPSQFGVFGIASLILAFLEILTETGINTILIQSKKEIAEYIDSAWMVSIARGFLIFCAMIIFAPFIAGFFKTPSAIGIILFLSLAPLVRGFINPSEIVFQKDLMFRNEFSFRTVLYFVDALVAVIVALFTHSVYSLGFGLLASAILEVVISFVFINPKPHFAFSTKDLNEIFHKGKWVTAWSVLNYFGDNGDNIVVGRLLGSSPLGVYQLAYKISILPISEISDVVNKVIFPVYSIIDEDRNRLFKAFIKTTFIVSLVGSILGIIIFAYPKEIILVLLGSKWLSAVSVLKVLAIYGIIRTILSSSSPVFLAIEKQNYVTIMTLVRSLALVATIIPLVSLFGILGAGYSALFSSIMEVPVILFLLYKAFKKK